MEQWKVLLVDDEKEFATTLAERLSLRGIETSVAYDGETGLRMIRENEPELVILDLMMPGMSGLAVLNEIKNNHPDICVILLTGMGSTFDGVEVTHLGAYEYLMKPINLDDLIRKIKEAMARRL